jgi:hypothetical protein
VTWPLEAWCGFIAAANTPDFVRSIAQKKRRRQMRLNAADGDTSNPK